MSGFAELLLLLACAPLHEGDYLGEPLVIVEGEILQEMSLSELEGEPSAAVVWINRGGNEQPSEGDPGEFIEAPVQHEHVWVETAFPAEYSLLLFDEPPEDARRSSPNGDEEIATGTVVLFMDLDDDGVIDWGDEGLVGAAERMFIAWNEAKGYSLGVVPEDCDGPGYQAANKDGDDVDVRVTPEICEVIVDPDCREETAEWGDDCAAHPGPPEGQ